MGEKPADMGVSESTGTVYVANYRYKGISVIDMVGNEIALRVFHFRKIKHKKKNHLTSAPYCIISQALYCCYDNILCI